MNSIQQPPTGKQYAEEKDEVATQAETFFGEDHQSFLEKLTEKLPLLKDEIGKQHEVIAKISTGTYTSDKVLRMLSAVCKLVRNWKLANNLKAVERFSGQVGQLRRLLRCDRLLLIIKEFTALGKKGKLSKLDKAMLLLKIMIAVGDLSDITAYLMQMNLISSQQLPALKRNVADIYFLECVGWLAYHCYEYWKSRDEEGKERNMTMVVRYTLDALCSHNDFSRRVWTLSPELTSVLGLASSALNLYLVWK